MRNRGTVYWEWADPELHFRNYDERLSCGTLINIQVRVTKENVTQLFVGIYGQNGALLFEEKHLECKGQTMTVAMAWALEQANNWVAQMLPAPTPKGPSGSRLSR